MEFHFNERATIELYNEELGTFREIVRLAADRLASAPAHQMRGVPLQRQAGLTGVDLFRVHKMLEDLGKKLGLDITEKTWERKSDPDSKPTLDTIFLAFVSTGATPNLPD